MNGMFLQNQADRPDYCQPRKHEENHERCRHFAPHVILARITKLVTITFAIESGSSNFHPNAINWSYRKRGSVPRIHTYTNRKTRIFDSSQNGPWINSFTFGNKTKTAPNPAIAAPTPGKMIRPKIVSYRIPSQMTHNPNRIKIADGR